MAKYAANMPELGYNACKTCSSTWPTWHGNLWLHALRPSTASMLWSFSIVFSVAAYGSLQYIVGNGNVGVHIFVVGEAVSLDPTFG